MLKYAPTRSLGALRAPTPGWRPSVLLPSFFLRAALISCMRSLLIDFVLILEKNLLDYHADCGVDCCDFGDCNTNC